MDREQDSIFPRMNLFLAPEKVINVARFVLNRLYLDAPAFPYLPHEEDEE